MVKLPIDFTGPFAYVDCGAAGDSSNPLLKAFADFRYIGFDPALSVPVQKDPSSTFFPVALAKEAGVAQFHRTRNPNCSSFYVPDQTFLDRFVQVGEFFRIIETIPLRVVALDEYLGQHGITDIDFIELDTQGSELQILQGATRLLASRVLGVRVEVEFTSMYQGQPLFADVDAFLRQFGFMLFDLERYHLKRKTAPANRRSREQIVWGQALYFKDWNTAFDANPKQKLSKLAVLASHYGFYSYSLEIMDYLLEDENQVLTLPEKAELKRIRSDRNQQFQNEIRGLLKVAYHRIRSSINSLKRVTSPANTNYFWKD